MGYIVVGDVSGRVVFRNTYDLKKVTAAYADKDLATLLKLEMQWVEKAYHIFVNLKS